MTGAGIRDDTARAVEGIVNAPLLARLAELQPESDWRYMSGEIGWGNLFADAFKNEARYCADRKAWYAYDGGRWATDPGGLAVAELCKSLADALHVYLLRVPDTERARFAKGWQSWQRRATRETVLKDAASVYPLCASELDGGPLLLNVQNGTLNLETLQLQPHDPGDLITKLAPVDYDPAARLERFDRFVSEVTAGRADLARCLQTSLGYALSGSTELEKLFIWHGATTRNGKSTLAETVLSVLGDYGSILSPEAMGTGRNTHGNLAATPDIAELQGVRFVNVSEPARELVLNAAKLKAWTGGDTVSARRLHENLVSFKPSFKFFMSTNSLPTTNDRSLFDSGRVVVVPFDVHFAESEQDKTLKQQFSTPEARSAILNWLLEGWRTYRAEGLALPSQVERATSEYAAEQDVARQFIGECLEPDPLGEVRSSELLLRFNAWAEGNGYPKESHRTFKPMLERAGVVTKRARPRSGGQLATLICGYAVNMNIASGLFREGGS